MDIAATCKNPLGRNFIVPRTVLLVLLLTAGAYSATAAGPREEVLREANRCSAISRSAAWLDCYYGAAQPMRSLLGLSSAPASQVQLAMDPPREASTVENADERAAAVVQAARCDQFGADRLWLDCYYAAAQPVRTTLNLSPVPHLPNVSGVTFPQAAAAKPFKSYLATARPAPTRSALISYTFDTHGFFTVHLANGQVWRQLLGDTDYARWREPAARYTVHISRGMLGSFNLNVVGSPKLFKVERIS